MRDPADPEKIGVFVVIWVSLATAALLGIVAAPWSGLRGAAPGGVARGLMAASQADAWWVESA